MLGNIGVLLGLAALIVMALRGVNVFVASLLSAAIVALTNQQSLAEALAGSYIQSMMGFAGMFFLLFLAGAVFGRVMGETKAAASIAQALSDALGPERILWIAMLACALLTYGGVNVFVVIFTVYPLGLGLMQQSNTPKRLFVGATSLGAGTFTMTALPGSPSIHNLISASSLETPTTAAPMLGLAASLVMVGLGMWYLESQRKRAVAAGEGFVPAVTDTMPKETQSKDDLPPWKLACVPLVVVLAAILVPSVWVKFVSAESLAEPDTLLLRVLAFSKTKALLWTCVALLLGTVTALALLRRWSLGAFGMLSRGAESCVLPLMNTAAVIGFGGVVKGTPAFGFFAEMMVGSGIHPLLSAALSINIVAGVVGSASGGLGIFFETLAGNYIAAGVDKEVLHRIVAIGSGGLDSLPHCGAIITTLTIMGITHKEGYRDIAVVTIAVPLVALIVVLLLALMGLR
jgi:H+/gluconate symporter-like permease